jgi:hypothetical protein
LSSTVAAPANRATPETRLWVASSVIAVVSVSPGSSTIRLAISTGLNASGRYSVDTAWITNAANSAATAS